MTTRPPQVYKYTDINGARKILHNGTLKFTCPRYFNDPMDIRKSLCCEDLDVYRLSAALRKKHIEVVMRTYYRPISSPVNTIVDQVKLIRDARIREGLTQQQVEKSVPQDAYLDASIVLCSPESKLEHNWLDKLNRSHVCCFTAVHPTQPVSSVANQLMWAHYADKHTGVVLGFDLKCEIGQKLKRVEYAPRLTPITNEEWIAEYVFGLRESAFDYTITSLYCTKSPCWAYEEEWRTIAYHDDNRGTDTFHPFDPGDLSSIHYGVRCPGHTREELEESACKYSNVCLYEARIKPGTFEMFEERYFP